MTTTPLAGHISQATSTWHMSIMSVANLLTSSHHSSRFHLWPQHIPTTCMSFFGTKITPLGSLAQWKSIHLSGRIDFGKWRSSLLRGVGYWICSGKSQRVQSLLTFIVLRHSFSLTKAEPRSGSHFPFQFIQLTDPST